LLFGDQRFDLRNARIDLIHDSRGSSFKNEASRPATRTVAYPTNFKDG